MRRFGRPVVVFGAALAFGSVQEGSSATLLWKSYKNPESETMRLLNQRHLDGIIDVFCLLQHFLHRNNDETLFCFPEGGVVDLIGPEKASRAAISLEELIFSAALAY